MRKEQGSGSYKGAGVDLDAAAAIKNSIKELAGRTFGSGVVSGVGGFGGVIKPFENADYYLVASTDSVGTKVKLAAMTGRYDVAGQDIVNHCVNDILPAGATPLFFLDYIASGGYSRQMTVGTVEGLVRACREAGCSLIGGETAAMPGIYGGDDYELAGFIVGTVAIDDYLQPTRTIRAGDVLIGMPSSGLHTNGYSLVRRIFGLDESKAALTERVRGTDATLGDALLQPHCSYLPDVRPVLKLIKGLAHITGGGLEENLPRVLPDGAAAELQLQSWTVPPLFRHIQEAGQVEDAEMFRAFNMGVGMIAAVSPRNRDAVLKSVRGGWVIGSVVERVAGHKQIKLIGP